MTHGSSSLGDTLDVKKPRLNPFDTESLLLFNTEYLAIIGLLRYFSRDPYFCCGSEDCRMLNFVS